MKKYLKFTLLVTLLSNLLIADVIFDLSAQHFSNSLDGNGEGARYNLSKTYVSTAFKYENGHYYTAGSGSVNFQVEIKNPLNSWNVTFDVSYFCNHSPHPNQKTLTQTS